MSMLWATLCLGALLLVSGIIRRCQNHRIRNERHRNIH